MHTETEYEGLRAIPAHPQFHCQSNQTGPILSSGERRSAQAIQLFRLIYIYAPANPHAENQWEDRADECVRPLARLIATS